MKSREMIVTNIYQEDGVSASQIIRKSFDIFLKQNLANLTSSYTVSYNGHDEWPLISGGNLCI